jgi:hypothetical protein
VIDAAACGSIAGAVAACITTPFDVAKTRIMLSGSGSTGVCVFFKSRNIRINPTLIGHCSAHILQVYSKQSG